MEMQIEKSQAPNYNPAIYGSCGCLLLVFFIVMVLIGSPSNNVKNNSPTTISINVSAADLWNEYNNNQILADEKYKGKYILVSGYVDSIGKDILDDPYITLITQDLGYNTFLSNVQCMLGEEAIGTASSMQKGQFVNIKGKVDGYLFNVIVRDCTFQ